MKPKIYIIILNYNGWADTIECLESVLRNDYPNYQVIVLDNNSPIIQNLKTLLGVILFDDHKWIRIKISLLSYYDGIKDNFDRDIKKELSFYSFKN